MVRLLLWDKTGFGQRSVKPSSAPSPASSMVALNAAPAPLRERWGAGPLLPVLGSEALLAKQFTEPAPAGGTLENTGITHPLHCKVESAAQLESSQWQHCPEEAVKTHAWPSPSGSCLSPSLGLVSCFSPHSRRLLLLLGEGGEPLVGLRRQQASGPPSSGCLPAPHLDAPPAFAWLASTWFSE